MIEYFKIESHITLLIIAGCIALLASILPSLLRRKHFSAPIIYIAIGAAIYLIYSKNEFHPLEHLDIIKHVTEFVILVALMNAGLRIKEPFSWRTWKYSIRLLVIAMPFTIVAAFFLGWWALGMAPATAMLFGALIAPTDPVLASELQTSEPGQDDTSKIRLGLTSEAGINDGLAFPFTYFAIMAFQKGLDFKDWAGEWFLHYFVIKIAIGAIMGLVSGWLLYHLVFSISNERTVDKISRGILSVALLLLPYALTEAVGGYGFIAVFLSACMFSNCEKSQGQMNSLHDFNEELESFVVALIFISTGVFIAFNFRIFLKPDIMLVSLGMVLIVRPLAGYLSLIKTGLSNFQKFVLSFYGMRGIGSIFYLVYALEAADFKDSEKLFAITTATIFFSVVIHGISSRSVQKRIKIYDNEQQ